MKKYMLMISALLVPLLSSSYVNASIPLEACGYHDLPLWMEKVPENASPWRQKDEDHMWLYNQYMSIFQSIESDGIWGYNDENEFGGFPTDDELYDAWGFSWGGGALAATFFWWYCDCCEIYESDIAFNPAFEWTGDREYAEDFPDDVIYYDSVLLHELAHSWGMQTLVETYEYDYPTVMHAYRPYSIQDHMTIHAPEAFLIRRQYEDQTFIPTLHNMVVVSKYAEGTWYNSWTEQSVYYPGSVIAIYNITAENTGTEDLQEVHIRFYLSQDRIISEEDALLVNGDWFWDSVPAESYGIFSFEGMEIPPDMEPGAYYVGAVISINGYQSDDISYDNTTYLWDSITVYQTASDADDDGISDEQDNCPEIPNGPQGGTCISGYSGSYCSSDEDCGISGACSMNQEDSDVDGVGDACELEPRCSKDSDCDDGNVCTDDACGSNNLCNYSYNTDYCDDGFYCNGTDGCKDGSCSEHSGNPCAEGWTCDENNQRCEDTAALCEVSINPHNIEVASGQPVTFTIVTSHNCENLDFTWTVESTIGSTIDQNGDYVAGINIDLIYKSTDVIRILDLTSGDVLDEATVGVSGSCFLTLLFGEGSEEIETLRKFRDNILSRTEAGRAIIMLYYQWSPSITQAIKESEQVKEDVLEIIDRIVSAI